MKKFRAWYKPDVNTKDGLLPFEQKMIDGKLYFVYEDIKYRFEVPFMDKDWIVEEIEHVEEYISWPEFVRILGRDEYGMVEDLYKINKFLTKKYTNHD